MTAFPYFNPKKIEFERGTPANHANPANPRSDISTISNISSPPLENADFLEAYGERCAIMEFDGGMTRQEAETSAIEDCNVIWLKKILRTGG